MKKLLLGLALILVPASAHAEDWVIADNTLSNQGVFFIDIDSIRAEGDNRFLRLLAVNGSDGELVAAIGEMMFDCTGRRNRILTVAAYNRQGGKIAEEGAAPWVQIVEGSNYAVVADMVCSGWRGGTGKHYGATPPIVTGRVMVSEAPPPPED